MDEQIVKSLIKRAKGYRYNEVQEEYAIDEEGKSVLTKKKVYKKYCPPDASAVKAYLDATARDSVYDMSDEELEKEKIKLLERLKAEELEK